MFKRAEKYVLEYRQREKEEQRLKREAKKANNYYIPPEAKLAIVVRIKGLAPPIIINKIINKIII